MTGEGFAFFHWATFRYGPRETASLRYSANRHALWVWSIGWTR